MQIQGKYTNIDVKATLIEESAIEQLRAIADNEHYKDTKIVIMPDAHAGKGCVVGFTMQYNKDNPVINPNIVGVDIGCGMLVQPIGKREIDLGMFDEAVKNIVNLEKDHKFENRFKCELDTEKRPYEYHNKQIGTLGFGNHFVEIGENVYGEKYIVIHTGSRHLGLRVCNYYMQKCIDGVLQGEDVQDYLYDMALAQKYASFNRRMLMDAILQWYDNELEEESWFMADFETVHNYIDIERGIIRKGAVSAEVGERLLIPLNMRDGSLLCKGKGNPAWNISAPHGAGRVMSRSEAKQKITLQQYEESMQGIYTSCVNKDTIDESVFAYKPMGVILSDIADTVDVVEAIKPIYNFKNNK